MITGFVLAGGASTRMGQDKAFLPFGASTLIESIILRIRPWVTRLCLIGSRANEHRLRDLNAGTTLIDGEPGCGPLMGIYTGLMHSETP